MIRFLFSISIFFTFYTCFCQTNTWTGATDSDWHKSCNWSLGTIPTCSHDVVIPNTANKPSVRGIAHCYTLELWSSSGATLTVNSLGGAELYVGQAGTCSGTPTNNGGCGPLCARILATGDAYSLISCSSGNAQSWGTDGVGELGDDAPLTGKTTPVSVATISSVKAVSAGGYEHGLAVKTDGTVWGWGENSFGQVGDNTVTQRPTPVQVLAGASGCVTNLCSIREVGAGYIHSLALKTDGTLWSWGGNFQGQIGDNTNNERHTPVQVSGLTGVISFSANREHSVAVKSDGTVWAWGGNGYGQLGDNTTASKNFPVQVSGLTNVIDVSPGPDAYHSIAVKNDGTVWAWGRNSNGQLGDNTTTDRLIPVQVSGLTNIIAVSTGGYFGGPNGHSLALKNDGTVWAWGYNNNGQLGDNTTAEKHIPFQVAGLSGIVAVSAGGATSMVLKNDGTIWMWGYNIFGQLGDGTTVNKLTPVQVTSACAVSCGSW